MVHIFIVSRKLEALVYAHNFDIYFLITESFELQFSNLLLYEWIF